MSTRGLHQAQWEGTHMVLTLLYPQKLHVTDPLKITMQANVPDFPAVPVGQCRSLTHCS